MRGSPRPLVTLVLCALLTSSAAAAAAPAASPGSTPLQFTSGGHVVGFTPQAVVVAAGSHALRVEFVGAACVAPAAAAPAAPGHGAARPARVTYPGLWEGISLAYDAPPDGVIRSTYTLAPGSDPEKIRLRYNAPVAVEPGGELRISYAAGTMRESVPVAWQQIDGRRIEVAVAFRKAAETDVGFALGPYDRAHTLTIDPTLKWNTFLGGCLDGSTVEANVGIDAAGNIYVAGTSSGSWGSPILPFAGGFYDAFVAKLDAGGNLVWNTFLGSAYNDNGRAIAVDAGGNVYVTGLSKEWGSPVRPYTAGGSYVAKLDANGNLQWNTFLGGPMAYAESSGIALDGAGGLYVVGVGCNWGDPIVDPIGINSFVSRVDAGGNLAWNTCVGGSSGRTDAEGVAADPDGNVFVAGSSTASWGNPIRAFTAGAGWQADAFVAKISPAGTRLWNTFLGGTSVDLGHGIATDADGNAYVAGDSDAPWGNPLHKETHWNGNAWHVLVAKLSPLGDLVWHTFPDGHYGGFGNSIAIDSGQGILITGESAEMLGVPITPYRDGGDAYVEKLSPAGVPLWHIFLGGTAWDVGRGIAVNAGGSVAVTGDSRGTWGTPRRAWGTNSLVFAASLPANPRVITVLSPNNGERWKRGTRHKITWRRIPTGGTVTIKLMKGPATYRTISTRAANTGAFSWLVPAGLSAGNSYKIKISSNTPPSVFDLSDKTFTIY